MHNIAIAWLKKLKLITPPSIPNKQKTNKTLKPTTTHSPPEPHFLNKMIKNSINMLVNKN